MNENQDATLAVNSERISNMSFAQVDFAWQPAYDHFAADSNIMQTKIVDFVLDSGATDMMAGNSENFISNYIYDRNILINSVNKDSPLYCNESIILTRCCRW